MNLLPAPTVQAHAANLMPLPGGDLACVWFGGTQEGMPDISIWFSRLRDGAWSPPARLSDDGTRSEQNPVLFPTPDGELWLLYTAQHAGDQDTAEVRLRVSADGGDSWGPARTLIPADPDGGVFIRQPIVVLQDRWLLPAFRCKRPATGRWAGDDDTSALYVSEDRGRTWRAQEIPDSTGCVHMNVLPLPDGTLLALFRSRWADHIHESRSNDGGRTWSTPVPTALPNNNSSIQATPLADGRLALVFNNSSRQDATERRASLYDEIEGHGQSTGKAFWGAPRAPLTLGLSSDGGRTWPDLRDLETGDGYCMTNNSREGLNRELSYPSIAQTPDGGLHVAYTYHRKVIKHVHIPAEEIDRV
ncbi:exo-alpha-sialidase [Nonomuraea sp. JJY05]|uniref:sialidase family protein n=1 Tax=Nonomuraea sp. JJY05 TaxID=3350255 RepID=UPI00373ECAF7